MSVRSFYDFSNKPFLTTLTFTPKNINLKNDDEKKLIKGEYEGINFPIICEYSRGKNIRDILDTGYVSLFLISDKFKEVLEKNHLTGWKSYPVKLLDKKRNGVTGYHGFSITGRSDPIDYNRSEIIKKRYVPEGPLCKLYKGSYIDLDKWDGSDFFLPKDGIKIVITERALKILKANKITNIHAKNLAEEETEDYLVKMILKHRREDLG